MSTTENIALAGLFVDRAKNHSFLTDFFDKGDFSPSQDMQETATDQAVGKLLRDLITYDIVTESERQCLAAESTRDGLGHALADLLRHRSVLQVDTFLQLAVEHGIVKDGPLAAWRLMWSSAYKKQTVRQDKLRDLFKDRKQLKACMSVTADLVHDMFIAGLIPDFETRKLVLSKPTQHERGEAVLEVLEKDVVSGRLFRLNRMKAQFRAILAANGSRHAATYV